MLSKRQRSNMRCGNMKHISYKIQYLYKCMSKVPALPENRKKYGAVCQSIIQCIAFC